MQLAVGSEIQLPKKIFFLNHICELTDMEIPIEGTEFWQKAGT